MRDKCKAEYTEKKKYIKEKHFPMVKKMPLDNKNDQKYD